jgi:hypothetical protein
MEKKVKNRKLLLRLLVTLVVFTFLCAPAVQAGKVQLDEGTEVKIKFDPGMNISSGNLQKGIPLLIYLAKPVEVGGKIILEEGAMGKAEVLEVMSASKPGKPGYLKVGFIDIKPNGDYKTLDGANVKLKGEVEVNGKGKKILSWIFIFGLFIRGGEATLPSDAIYTIHTAETIRLSND